MKKNLLFFFFCLQAFCLSAQNINFPDPNFKAAILSIIANNTSVIDVNGDGEISVSEAAACTNLAVSDKNISNLSGIENFVNLTSLGVGMNNLTTLDLSALTNLVSLTCYYNPNLTSLTISSTEMWFLDCSHCNLSSLIIPPSTSMYLLKCGQNNLSSLDVTGFPQLSTLSFFNNHIGNIDVSNCPHLSALDCSKNELTSLNVNNCHNLRNLSCSNNHISSLNVQPCPLLETLGCQGYNPVTSLDLSNLANLKDIDLDSSNITSVNGAGMASAVLSPWQVSLKISHAPVTLTSLDGFNIPALTILKCYSGYMNHLNVAVYPNLNTLWCSANPILNLNVSSNPQLKELFCGSNGLTSLDLHGNPELSHLECMINSLSDLDLSMNPKLNWLQCNMNNIDTLDLSMTAVDALDCGQNPLVYINSKNAVTQGSFTAYGTQSTLRYICADDADISVFLNYFDQEGGFNVSANSYCSFPPGGQSYTANGTIRLDMDNNGCTPADIPAGNVRVQIDDGSQQGATFTNSAAGDYQFYLNPGSYTLTPQFFSPYFSASPLNTVVSLSSSNPLQTTDFCVAKNGIHHDLEVLIIPSVPPNPGFVATYQLVYHNKGTEVESGNVQLDFDDSKLDFNAATVSPTTQSTGSLSWNYSNLQPFESRTIGINLNVLPPPINNINDSLIFNASIDPVAGDETTIDNSFRLRDSCVGSYDPNGKVCMEGKRIDITKAGDYLHYVIRFQNTGNDTAINVVLKDVLANKYDWKTVQVIGASAPYNFKQTGNKIEVFFYNIKLPDSSTNEPGSHGYFAFKIKPVSTIAVGNILINKASIYFDFNLPIVTHNAITTVVAVASVPVSMEYFKGNISGDKNILHWKANCSNASTTFEIERSNDSREYKKIGRLSADYIRCQQPFDFTDEHPAAALNYYRLKVIDPDGKFHYSAVIALLNKKDGFEIVSLTPNPVVGATAVLNIASAENQPVTINISDATGRVVRSVSKIMIAGSNQVEMDVANFSKGIYTVSVNVGNGQRRIIQFVKQ